MHTVSEAGGSPREAGGCARDMTCPIIISPTDNCPQQKQSLLPPYPVCHPLSPNAGAEATNMECNILSSQFNTCFLVSSFSLFPCLLESIILLLIFSALFLF